MLFPNEGHPATIGGFKVLERLGTGGAGKVYLARSKGGRLVAVKVLGNGAMDDPEVAGTLAHEASLCVRLSHPAIVQVRALVEDEGVSALVFDYVEGVALGRLLRFLSGQGERLADEAAWHIIERVLSALAYAHQQVPPIVHRDVSPSNVLLDWSGDAKLTDFGMAKMLGAASNTQLGLVKGTLGCMAPEQARGDAVTERADVYAAGLLAWRLATGFAPFGKYRDQEVEMVRAMKNPRIPPLAVLRPDLPASLCDVVGRALEPNPELRRISAEEMRLAVCEAIDTAPGRKALAAVLEIAREDLARATPMGGMSTKSSKMSNAWDGERASAPSVVTSRYSEAAQVLDEPDLARLQALKPFSPRSVPPTTGTAPALEIPSAPPSSTDSSRDDETSPGRSRLSNTPSLSSMAASQASAEHLGLRRRRRKHRRESIPQDPKQAARTIFTMAVVAVFFFAIGLALGLAMGRD